MAPGDFWAVPLCDGSFSAGRVLELPGQGTGSRTSFLGGLIDWRGWAEPSADDLAGSAMLARGQMHLRAITQTGGAILGSRQLELDGIEPEFAISGGRVMRGLAFVRPAVRADYLVMPALTGWGFGVIRVLAEKQFLEGGIDPLSRLATWPYLSS